MNLKNFPALQRFFCKFLRIEADTEIVLDQGQTLIGRCNFQIRTERKAVGRKVLNMKISGAGIILQRDKRIFRKFFQRADVSSQFFVFRTGDQNFPERTKGNLLELLLDLKSCCYNCELHQPAFQGSDCLRSGMVGNLKPYMWIMIVKCF